MPEPTTRSLTVLDTSTLLGPASAPIRAPMFDCHAADVVAGELALAGVKAGPHFDAGSYLWSAIACAQRISLSTPI